MPKDQTLKNAVLGTAVAILLYLIPGINIVAPLIAGAVAGYSQRQGLKGGFKVGVIMAFFMLLPGFFISSLLMQIPEIGLFLSAGWMAISMLVIGHALVMSVLGGMIGGALGENHRI